MLACRFIVELDWSSLTGVVVCPDEYPNKLVKEFVEEVFDDDVPCIAASKLLVKSELDCWEVNKLGAPPFICESDCTIAADKLLFALAFATVWLVAVESPAVETIGLAEVEFIPLTF